MSNEHVLLKRKHKGLTPDQKEGLLWIGFIVTILIIVAVWGSMVMDSRLVGF
jgi:hypothetical protein